MKINDLVSIIIPCYNQAQYLEESVHSAIDQTYPNIEIIIINDGSTDNSEEVALSLQEKYPEKIRVISQKNSGVSEARNNGIRKALGTYILPLDADDLIDKNMVSYSLESMKENNADIVYVAIKYFGVKNFIDNKKPFSENNILYQNPCSVTSLYKKEIWDILGGYTKNMKEGYEDWEFWINAFKHGFKFQLLSEPFLLYRTQELSRNMNAAFKDSYLKAKITLNHSELYTTHQIHVAINFIKEYEGLPNLYFYYSKDLSINEVSLSAAISRYLSSNELQESQLITIPDTGKKVGFYPLNTVKNSEQLKELYKETEADFILFYAPLRYEIPSLKNLDFAWDKDNGIIDTRGTIFPFVFQSEREDCRSQLLAYKRLVRYQNEKIDTQLTYIKQQRVMIESKIETIDKQESRIQEKNKLIEMHRKTIEDKDTLIKKKIETVENQESRIQEKNKLIEMHRKTIEDKDTLIGHYQLPISRKAILKYKAYKYMLKTYFELQRTK